VPSAAGVIPRKLIVVRGVANRSPGEGETVAILAREVVAPANPLAEAVGPPSPVTTATAKAITPA
jgi:hypothetical protein